MKTLALLKHKDRLVQVIDLKDAYTQGYYSNSMTRDELMDRVTKYNPQLKWIGNKTSVGLFDTTKKRSFICGIGLETTLPQFTFIRYDRTQDRELCRSDEHGNILHRELLNMDSDKGKCLMRSWRCILNIVKSVGYEVQDEDLF